MRIHAKSPLADVARVVSAALLENGIEAVLTGGACASLYTAGAYLSSDLDFVVGDVATRELDRVMRTIGFGRIGSTYRHPETEFFVEFLPGPLGIGRDLNINPVPWTVKSPLRVLSPTDSCRDRLAAFYFWNDRQSLRVAIQIARRHRVNIEVIERWSAEESRLSQFKEFQAELKRSSGKGAGISGK